MAICLNSKSEFFHSLNNMSVKELIRIKQHIEKLVEIKPLRIVNSLEQVNRDLSQTWRYRVLCCHVFCHVVVMSSHYSI